MRWYGVLAVLIVLLLGAAAPAAAQPVRPLDQILPQIRSSHPGTFYDAEGPFRGPDGRMHYRLKWMTPSGRIIWLDTDARTGRVLGRSSGPRRPAWERGERSERRYAPSNRGRNNWRDERRGQPRYPWRQDRGRQYNPPRGDSYWRQRGRPNRDNRREERREYRRDRGGDRDGGGRRGGRRHHW